MPTSRSASSTTAKPLPLNLHGLKGPEVFGGVYMSRDRLAAWRADAPDPTRWIVIGIHGIPDWASEGEVRTTGVPFRVTDAEAQIAAVRQGLGMTTLPCFVGDADPPAGEGAGRRPAHVRNALASHTGETRKTKRVRLFHGVHIPQARRIRAASRRAVYIARLTPGSPTRLVRAAGCPANSQNGSRQTFP